jgi:hypothetical protein
MTVRRHFIIGCFVEAGSNLQHSYIENVLPLLQDSKGLIPLNINCNPGVNMSTKAGPRVGTVLQVCFLKTGLFFFQWLPCNSFDLKIYESKR